MYYFTDIDKPVCLDLSGYGFFCRPKSDVPDHAEGAACDLAAFSPARLVSAIIKRPDVTAHAMIFIVYDQRSLKYLINEMIIGFLRFFGAISVTETFVANRPNIYAECIIKENNKTFLSEYILRLRGIGGSACKTAAARLLFDLGFKSFALPYKICVAGIRRRVKPAGAA